LTSEKDSKTTRPTNQGPYGSTHGNAVGRVWETGRKIEINVDGLKVIAGLLEGEAPLRCRAFLDILPYEGTVVHLKWSGDGFQSHGPSLEEMVPKHGLGMENFTVIASRGDILFWVRDRGLFICYGYMYSRGNTGEEPSNLFAHVRPQDYSKLYEIGRKVFNEGRKKVSIKLLE
jgi:hypothetical protein